MRNIFWQFVFHCVLVAGGTLHATDGPRELALGTDIVREWKPEQHLFVKGTVGVSGERLAELELWLDANAANWTILLAEDADRETFADPDGGTQRGLDAVEFAIGRGLPRTTGFADLVDARTGERNGAALAIFLKERAFSYTGSEAQNRRMLGEAQWEGNLDRPAFRAMSNGGRIVDAVKDTVKEIEARLTQQLALEQRARERGILEAKRQENAAKVLRDARGDLEKLAGEVAAFGAAIPGGTGDLLRPDLAAMRAELDAGDARLADGEGAAAARTGAVVAEWVRGQRQAMAAYREAPAEFEDLEARLAGIAPGEMDAQWGMERLAQAKAQLEKGRAAHRQGNSAYTDSLGNARQTLDSAEEEIARAKAERAAKIQREHEETQRAEARARRLRNTGIGVGGALSVLFAGVGVVLNRRRRPAREEAEALLSQWESGAREKREGLFALLDRTTVVIGSAVDLSQRGYTGDTLRLGEQTIADVDELFIMSSAVERVLREARELIQPGAGIRGGVNLVSGGNFHQAMRLLRDEPITFTPDEGIELIVRGDADEKRGLLGNLGDYRPFALSFNELVGEFNKRAERALESLDRIENAWATIHRELNEAGETLEAITDQASSVAALSEKDGLFPVPALSAKWLQRARENLGEAVTMAAGDPVAALSGPLPQAKRKGEEILALCDAIDRAREVSIPAIRGNSDELGGAGHATGWVGDSIRALSDEANKISLAGGGESVGERVRALADAMTALEARVAGALSLSVRMREKSAPSLEALGNEIEAARAENAKVLALPVEKVLCEEGDDPDDQLAEGWRQQAAAKAAINRGDVEGAEGALTAVQGLVAEAKGILSDTRASLFGHAGTVADLRARKEALEHVAEKNAAILGELKEDYNANALLADADDKTVGSAEASIEKHVDLSEAAMARAWALADRGDTDFRKARLLGAASLLAEAEQELGKADQWLGAIPEQKRRIEQTEAANGLKIEQVDREAAGLRENVADARITEPTRSDFERNARALELVRRNLKASRRDPFALARELARIDEALDAVSRSVDEDARWYAETERSLREADAALETARDLSHRVASDAIPDSARMLEMQEEVERLRLREAELHRQFKVPHGDWKAIDVEADQITAAAINLVGEMRGELERAEAAVTALAGARASVREASGWSGAYGVKISGTPGAELLHVASDLLQRGAYDECLRRAEDASRSARHAVSEANALVARHRAEDQQREDERRRAESQRRASSFSGSSSSFGGSSRSSSSGMSRSSFSSSSRSGSGMGRSGW